MSLKTIPGIVLCIAIAGLGMLLSDFIGKDLMGFAKSPVPAIMLAIVLGLLVGNLVKLPELFQGGIIFSLKKILKLGIICLGIRLELIDMLAISTTGLPLIIACICSAMLTVHFLSKRIDVPSKMAALIAVGTSICGATAIIATGPVIAAKKEEITYAVATITIFGVMAMFTYPFVAHALFDPDIYAAGLFLGTSIHDTAQVAGAGMIYAEQYNAPKALDYATATKLVRNVSMMLVIPLMSYLYREPEGRSDKPENKASIISMFPTFILGFILLILVRALGDYSLTHHDNAFFLLDAASWKSTTTGIETLAKYALTVAMAAVGLNTNLKSLWSLGLKPFAVGFTAALSVGLVSYLGIQIIQALG